METKAKPTYHGWANFETWVTHLWLTNEQSSSALWTDRARAVRDQAAPDEDQAFVVGRLASELCEDVSERCSLEGASLAADLMAAALERVDWHQIAQTFLEDLEPPAVKKSVPLGLVVATPGALQHLTAHDRDDALARHARGDWGEVDPEDGAENELSLKDGGRILSVYRTAAGMQFWVITEADRSATTLLLPSEF